MHTVVNEKRLAILERAIKAIPKNDVRYSMLLYGIVLYGIARQYISVIWLIHLCVYYLAQ